MGAEGRVQGFYVYRWVNRLNGKQYVGKGHAGRAAAHAALAAKNPTQVFHQAIRKHGESSFWWEYLATGLTEVEALELEQVYVHLLGSNLKHAGYNMTAGGDGTRGHRHTAESRRQMSENAPKTKSPEHREKVAASHRGRKRSEETKRRTPEYAEKFAEAQRKAYSKRKKVNGQFAR